MEKKKMVITYEALCKDCGGSGHCQSEPCRLCGATGYVEITKNIDISVSPSGGRPVKTQIHNCNS